MIAAHWIHFLLPLVSLVASAPLLATCAPATHHRKDTNVQVCSSLGCAKGHEGSGAVRFTLPFAQVSYVKTLVSCPLSSLLLTSKLLLNF